MTQSVILQSTLPTLCHWHVKARHLGLTLQFFVRPELGSRLVLNFKMYHRCRGLANAAATGQRNCLQETAYGQYRMLIKLTELRETTRQLIGAASKGPAMLWQCVQRQHFFWEVENDSGETTTA